MQCLSLLPVFSMYLYHLLFFICFTGGRLLDNTYKKVSEETKKTVAGKSVTLIQDGWSDVHNSPIIANVIHTGKHVQVT